ncbi:potassium channel subfamily K member 6 isoform X1 [Leptinotarsa decemlineata]|uniref:potassium channel subfamily K member 6 isoform X1 n=1 Tax=Leptinotarsa decemlineata TaxID=7539 RepID=UPI003D305A5C
MDFCNYGTVNNNSSSIGDDEEIGLLPKIVEGNRNKIIGMEKTSFRFSLYLFAYFMFLCSGAAVFSYFEAPEERALRVRLGTAVQKFLVSNPNVTDADLEELIVEIVRANNRGVSAIENATSEPNWSFGQSFFFASTVITTIGYGHVTPLSRNGKLFCMFYAVVGIPLTLVLLSALVERLLIPTVWLLQWLNSKLGHLYQPLRIQIVHLAIIVLVLLVFFLLLPAAIFASLEPEWDYLDSLYYCFISLTTIGLGDYIPGDSAHQPYRPLYKIMTTCYLFLGITIMMLTLTVFYDIPQLNLGLLFTTSEDSEKVRLASSGPSLQYGAGFSPHNEENIHRQVVRVRSRHNDSPSPEEPPHKGFP